MKQGFLWWVPAGLEFQALVMGGWVCGVRESPAAWWQLCLRQATWEEEAAGLMTWGGGAGDQERRGMNMAPLLRRAVQAEQGHLGSQTVLYTRVPQGWLTLRLQPTDVMLTCSPVSADAAA